jgi:hypothetical protein
MTDEPTIISLLRDQISTLEANLNKRLDITEDSVTNRFDQQDNTLKRIEAQVQKTNGRVTVLERARDRAQGVVTAFRWIPFVLGSGLTAGLTILVMALSGGLK